MFQTIQLFWLPNQHQAESCALEAARILLKHGVRPLLPGKAGKDAVPELLLSFGGDGALLAAAREAIRWDIPLMGVNLGTVGFLTEEEPARLEAALEEILSGRYTLEERELLSAELPGHEPALALNDVVVSRGGYARLIKVGCRVNGEEYGTFMADGMIVATPTGSTGYSLSAGGPIVEPGTDCMLITLICAHSLQRHSSVVSSRSEVRLTLQADRVQSALLQIDGQSVANLHAGDEVTIRTSEQRIRLLRLHPSRFFTLIRRKLSEWGSLQE